MTIDELAKEIVRKHEKYQRVANETIATKACEYEALEKKYNAILNLLSRLGIDANESHANVIEFADAIQQVRDKHIQPIGVVDMDRLPE